MRNLEIVFTGLCLSVSIWMIIWGYFIIRRIYNEDGWEIQDYKNREVGHNMRVTMSKLDLK